jgi:hypothetical protein
MKLQVFAERRAAWGCSAGCHKVSAPAGLAVSVYRVLSILVVRAARFLPVYRRIGCRRRVERAINDLADACLIVRASC